jgi:hypothetical protein
MKYLSKLSNRMAQMHASLALAALLALAGCIKLEEPISFDDLVPPDETIPLPETSRTCDNEPAGYTRAFEATMSALPSRYPDFSPEGFTYFDNQARTLFVEQSSSAPLSPSSVLRVAYPRGAPGGASPSRWGSRQLPANTGNIYVCGWIRFMPGWSSNGNIGTKLFFIKGPDETNHFVGSQSGADNQRAFLMSGLQFRDDNLSYNLGELEFTENDLAGGGWHKFEVLWEANTPGLRDGRYSHWVDGRLIGAAANALYFLETQQPGWDQVWFDPTFGGGANPVPHDQYFDLDHFVASVR